MSVGFFTGQSYHPAIDLKVDFVSVRNKIYIQGWRDGGYERILCGISTGHDLEYCTGDWDGSEHFNEVQRSQHPDRAWEGSSQTWTKVPIGNYLVMSSVFKLLAYYMVPTKGWTSYLKKQIKEYFDLGVAGIEFDEPEFWHRAGYSEAFKQEWQHFYNEPWRDPCSEFDARYKAEQLKSFLYSRLIQTIFRYIKTIDPKAECICNPHSPINYAEGFQLRSTEAGITSPISEMIRIPWLDAILGEVWSDTIKAPVLYAGHPRIEPFFHAYVERSYFTNLVRKSGKRLYHLLDPKSDDPKYEWTQYRKWFEQDFLAALMVGGSHFIVAWPERLFFSHTGEKAPHEYVTLFSTAMRVCKDISRYPIETQPSIGLPISDSIMWERGEPGIPHLDGFYNLAFPLLEQGILLDVFPLERIIDEGYLDSMNIILISYELGTPPKKEHQDCLIRWIKKGGTLVYFGSSDFHDMPRSWWRKDGYLAPQNELLHKLGMIGNCSFEPLESSMLYGLVNDHPLVQNLGKEVDLSLDSLKNPVYNPVTPIHIIQYDKIEADCIFQSEKGKPVVFEKIYGKGTVLFVGVSPRFFAYTDRGPQIVGHIIRYAAQRAGIPFEEKGYLDLRRGPYHMVYAQRKTAKITDGPFIDLLDHRLPVILEKTVPRKKCALLYKLSTLPKPPEILYCSSLISKIRKEPMALFLQAEGPTNSKGTITIFGPPSKRKKISIWSANDENLLAWEEKHIVPNTFSLGYNHGQGSISIQIIWD